MPLRAIQLEVLATIAAHRNPESYVAGGTVINRAADSYRYSQDIDIFHEAAEAVRLAAATDAETLTMAGFAVTFGVRQPGFVRAIVSRDGASLKLEWVVDTAFRFFPVLPDPELGYRLHDADAATNKVLALANRTVLRDVIDLVQLHRRYLPLGALCWAACGKDPGFTPELLLDCLARNARISPDLLAAEALAQPLDLRELKRVWRAMLEDARRICAGLPAADLGCLYLDDTGVPRCPPGAGLRSHFGSVRGSWPRVVEGESPTGSSMAQ